MQYTWLSISVFCHSDNNHRVLRDGILPIINRLQDTSVLKNWYFQFGDVGGPSIELPMLVENGNVNSVAEDVDNSLKSFFLTANFETVTLPISIDNLYEPFPLNSIRFGLYDVTDYYDDPYIVLRQIISQTFIGALCEEAVNDEALLSLALYLYFIIIRQALTLKQGHEELREFLLDSHGTLYIEPLVQEELNDLLTGVEKDINLTTFPSELSWLTRWEQLFNSDHYLSNPLEIFKLINKQLYIPQNVLNIVIYLSRNYLMKFM